MVFRVFCHTDSARYVTSSIDLYDLSTYFRTFNEPPWLFRRHPNGWGVFHPSPEEEMENQLNLTNESVLLKNLGWKPRFVQNINDIDIKTKNDGMSYKAATLFFQESYLLWEERHEWASLIGDS